MNVDLALQRMMKDDRQVAGWRGLLAGLQPLDREVLLHVVQGNAPLGQDALRMLRNIANLKPTIARVRKALTDSAAKAKWFTGGNGYTLLAREMDVRPGGREHVKGRWETGVVSTFDAVYHDVVADERIVYAYEMHSQILDLQSLRDTCMKSSYIIGAIALLSAPPTFAQQSHSGQGSASKAAQPSATRSAPINTSSGASYQDAVKWIDGNSQSLR